VIVKTGYQTILEECIVLSYFALFSLIFLCMISVLICLQ
jgi:hypothetical protein